MTIELPEPMGDSWLYHWSPVTRHKGISRYGIVPGKRSVCKVWRPPYVAFGLDPLSAWQMSGAIHPEIPEWDLWAVHTEILEGFEMIPYDDGSPREIRVYDPIPGRDLFYVGARKQEMGNRG